LAQVAIESAGIFFWYPYSAIPSTASAGAPRQIAWYAANPTSAISSGAASSSSHSETTCISVCASYGLSVLTT